MPMIASNSPEPGPAQKPTNTPRLTIWWILGAVALGIITGAIGTVMHLNSWWTGSFGLPWGVVIALAVVALAQWWIGLRTAHILTPGLVGLAQYATVAVMITASRGDVFGIMPSAQLWEVLPHLVIASIAWYAGIVVITIAVTLRLGVVIRRAKASAGVAA